MEFGLQGPRPKVTETRADMFQPREGQVKLDLGTLDPGSQHREAAPVSPGSEWVSLPSPPRPETWLPATLGRQTHTG